MPNPALLAEQGGVFTSASVQAINALISGQGFLTQGNVYWVRPTNGNDINNGLSPATAFQTLAAALAATTANQNDVVLLCAEGNSANATTARQNALLDWNKDMVHLIGLNSGPLLGQRSRIAFTAAYAGATDLFKLSANGCLIQGIEFFMGVASVNPTGCVTVTGQHNVFRRCQIAGMGNTANDISGAYSLQLKGCEESLFDDCTIGQDTVQLGAGTSNSVILFAANAGVGVTRVQFRNCRILLNTSSATACLFIRAAASTMDREQIFEDCQFLNAIASGSTTLTHGSAIVGSGSPGGTVILTGSKTGVFGASGWNSTSASIYATGGIQATNSTWGLATAITS